MRILALETMRRARHNATTKLAFSMAALVAFSCEVKGEEIELPPLPDRVDDAGLPVFTCRDENSVACERNVHLSCRRTGEFLMVDEVDCGALGKVCNPERQCMTCSPTSARCQPCDDGDEDCDPNVVQRCSDDGDRWEETDRCDIEGGSFCFQGRCQNMCRQAEVDKSYVGCEFFAADLDNAAINDIANAAAQQFAVAVTNPQSVPVEVTVEINEGRFGEEAQVRALDSLLVPPGGLEVFELPRRELDGSSDDGLNDGTHTAVTSNAFRVWSSHPIIAYQFNPLENVDVFSNDASLLLPTSAIGTRYTVVGWPQTIGSDDSGDDFDMTSADLDLRAFLTIIGTREDTDITVTFGPDVGRVVGAGPVPESRAFDSFDLTLGPFDVVNLETEGFNADFTGTVVDASEPVTVFIGSEASDVPVFGNESTRQCCADHLEEQLFPDRALGTLFVIARMPSRTRALVAAAPEDDPVEVAVSDELEWVRVIAVAEGITDVSTTLPRESSFQLRQGEEAILTATQDFELESSHPIAVLQALPSQEVTGIPQYLPGGDPAIIAVPPVEQYRQDYIFLTPDKYLFDFVTINATAGTSILLDGEPLPESCETAPADGVPRRPGDRPPDRVIHRCQLSFPEVPGSPNLRPRPGRQDDGVHTIVADREVGIIVYGFDRFVSYAYAGGLNLDVLN